MEQLSRHIVMAASGAAQWLRQHSGSRWGSDLQSNSIKRTFMRSKFVRFQLRDLLFIALPALLMIGVIWLALRFVNPAPPGTLVLSRHVPAAPIIAMPSVTKRLLSAIASSLKSAKSGGSHWPISRHFPIQPQVWMQASFKEA